MRPACSTSRRGRSAWRERWTTGRARWTGGFVGCSCRGRSASGGMGRLWLRRETARAGVRKRCPWLGNLSPDKFGPCQRSDQSGGEGSLSRDVHSEPCQRSDQSSAERSLSRDKFTASPARGQTSRRLRAACPGTSSRRTLPEVRPIVGCWSLSRDKFASRLTTPPQGHPRLLSFPRPPPSLRGICGSHIELRASRTETESRNGRDQECQVPPPTKRTALPQRG